MLRPPSQQVISMTSSSRVVTLVIAPYWLRWAVQYPEQRSAPMCPLHVPRPEFLVSLPEPDAYLSCTVTDARTAPVFPTYPWNFTRLGWLTIPSVTLTENA